MLLFRDIALAMLLSCNLTRSWWCSTQLMLSSIAPKDYHYQVSNLIILQTLTNHFWLQKNCLKIIQNYSKCRILMFEFWHFPPFFVISKVTCLVTLFDRKLHIFKNSPKWTTFGIFYKLLSTPNVNVARFARNVEWDFFCDFQPLCRKLNLFLLCCN